MTNWWKNGIVYHLYIKSFYDSNKNGIGDLNGVKEKLNYLETLGIDAIWFSPFFKSPMRDNGYDISDYKSVNSLFGLDEDLEAVFSEMKKKNMKIIIDLVLNHCSINHEWFKEAIKDKNSKYRDYFIFKNENEINNARSIFGGPCWTKVADGQYYYHTFAVEQADLNWENPQLRHEIYDIINYWIDKGVDGFRLDAITFIKKDQPFVNLEADDKDGLFACVKTSLNKEGILEFFDELKAKTWGNKDIFTVGEAAGITFDNLDQYIEPKGLMTTIFDFSYTDIDISGDSWLLDFNWDYKDFQDRLDNMQLQTQKVGHAVTYLENHDNPRSLNKFFKQHSIDPKHHFHMATGLNMFFMFLRGTSFIYQGQEIGMQNIHFNSIDDFEDLHTFDQYERAISKGMSKEDALKLVNKRSRDHSRVPVYFDDEILNIKNRIKPFVSEGISYGCDSVEKQIVDKNSILNFVKEIIKTKKSEVIEDFLINSVYEVYHSPDDIISYRRRLGSKEMTVLINMTHKAIEFEQIKGNVLMSNYHKKSFDGQLEAYEAVIINNF